MLVVVVGVVVVVVEEVVVNVPATGAGVGVGVIVSVVVDATAEETLLCSVASGPPHDANTRTKEPTQIHPVGSPRDMTVPGSWTGTLPLPPDARPCRRDENGAPGPTAPSSSLRSRHRAPGRDRATSLRAMADDPLQILAPDGSPVGEVPIGLEETRRLYRGMVAARTYDRKCSALQRQGRLATYAPFEGQEAAQIGAAGALGDRDWLVATYRDAAAMWFRGYPLVNLILGRTGDERGGSPPEDVFVLPPSITVGAHMLHAVGLGWAARVLGEDRIALTMFGDGATSEGDFHEAMNFAAVYRTPTVFLCQNNGWAISLPRHRQTASETIAQKADAYGMPGVLVDGNDLFAVHRATTEARERARAGEGPTLIEALTYRIGAHTTADDPGRYREGDEVEEWRRRDPLERVRAYLAANDAWDVAWQEAVEEEQSALVEEAVAGAEALDPLTPEEMFSAMFAEPTAALRDQLARLERGE